MMARTVTTTVYQFDELNDNAKERARDWYRSCIESDEISDNDDWQAIAEILGITFKSRAVPLMGGGTRYDPCIWWSGFSSQGDGASFEGSYSYAKKASKRIREHAPQDTKLHRIADELTAVQRQHFYRLEAKIERGAGSNFYSHSGTMAVEVFDREDNYRNIGDADETVRQAMRDFADWIYRQLEAQWECLHSAEVVDDNIRANEYEFTEDGHRA